MKAINEELRNQLKVYQKTEITEHHIYMKLAQSTKNPGNRRILEEIAQDELKHCEYWREYTQEELAPNRIKVWMYYLISRVLGITFGIKLMEMGEEDAQDNYEQLVESIPDIDTLIEDENEHERVLLNLLDEERLRYMGSIVLGYILTPSTTNKIRFAEKPLIIGLPPPNWLFCINTSPESFKRSAEV